MLVEQTWDKTKTENANLNLNKPNKIDECDFFQEKMKACEENLKKKKEEVLRITQEVERLMPQLKERRDAFSTSKVELRSALVSGISHVDAGSTLNIKLNK